MPTGALFTDVLMGADEQKILLGTDAGYGFVAKIGDLYTKTRPVRPWFLFPKVAVFLVPRQWMVPVR
jgi:topoisomerase-4 subunit A